MKTKFMHIIAALCLVLGLGSCNLDYFPDDELNSNVLLQDAKGGEYIMDGCYALLKDEVEFLGYASGNTYVRHYMQMTEFPADNTCLSSHTTDPLYEATAYMMTDNLKNVGTLWMIAYKVIFMTNTVIENMGTDDSDKRQILGEAYFMRALMHLHMVTLYAKPYSHGRENLGVPLHINTTDGTTKRNTVGECYDQIVKDLQIAADLLEGSRGNAGYPSKDAALGILSRVYLYMEDYDNCIKTVDQMLAGADPSSKIMSTADFATYFANTKTAKETLFCIAHEITDDTGQSSAGSMYYRDEIGKIGWGEIYPSVPLQYLYDRYPTDIRATSLFEPRILDESEEFIWFPDPETPNDQSGRMNLKFKVTKSGETYSFKDEDGTTYNVEKRTVNGEYFEYHVKYKGEDCVARITPKMEERNTHPKVYIKKLSFQDGNPMLCSPVMCRWGEVILNAAEAYARSGNDTKALEYVNIIRTRAGIPEEGLFAAGKMHGYSSVADVVMDERRLELAFEGHRMFDVYRNKQNMDRRYPGAQPWKIVEYTEPHIQYPIPNNEWTTSGIPQNPGY